MANMRFNDTDTASGSTALTYNPRAFDQPGDYNIDPVGVLHGSPVWQEVKFDSRIRKFIWSGNRVDDSNISSMITFFKGKKGEIQYIQFGGLDAANTMWPTSDNWKKVRIINVKTVIRQGGELIYDSIELSVQPEE